MLVFGKVRALIARKRPVTTVGTGSIRDGRLRMTADRQRHSAWISVACLYAISVGALNLFRPARARRAAIEGWAFQYSPKHSCRWIHADSIGAPGWVEEYPVPKAPEAP